MSDYLENLVAKSRNRADVMQPRPASLFEPSSAGGPLVDPFTAGFDTPQGERLASDIQDDRARNAITPSLQSASARPPVASLGRTDRVLPPPATDTLTPNTRQGPVTVATPSSLTPVVGSATLRRASGEPPGPETARLPPRPTEHAESSFALPNKVSPATIVTSHERVAPLLGPSAPSSSGQSAEEIGGPTIKISIGRVDVRAIMPALRPSPPAPRRRSPALSLADYLKRNDQRKP